MHPKYKFHNVYKGSIQGKWLINGSLKVEILTDWSDAFTSIFVNGQIVVSIYRSLSGV